MAATLPVAMWMGCVGDGDGDGDGGCPAGTIELCTGPEPCKNGKTCQVLQILNGDKRVVGACL